MTTSNEELIDVLAKLQFASDFSESQFPWDDADAIVQTQYRTWAQRALTFFQAGGWAPATLLQIETQTARQAYNTLISRGLDYPDGTGEDARWRGAEFVQLAAPYLHTRKGYADWARHMCLQMHAGRDDNQQYGTWEHIITKEWAELLACNNAEQIRRKLPQLIAVATAWAEAIDARDADENA